MSQNEEGKETVRAKGASKEKVAKQAKPKPLVDKQAKDQPVVKRKAGKQSPLTVHVPMTEPRRKAAHSRKAAVTQEPPLAVWFGDFDRYLLQEGTHAHAYEKLGAHSMEMNGQKGVHFAVWAPNASRVSVVGDFNDWDSNRHLMQSSDSGIWNRFIPGLQEGMLYKYALLDRDGHLLPLKADPYAFAAEHPPATASCIASLPKVAPWQDARQDMHDPITIYEVHLASWRRADGNRPLTYPELAEQLIPYVKGMGFTHIELMPIAEHPFSGSWGYQPTGLFAPTSRYGTPQQFADFIAQAHQAGLHVLIDWVPGHFPNDPHGLARFDGTHLYEHQDPREGKHQDWDTLIYNYGRSEVANFLLSNALFWLDRYGADGLRVDAVASMIYRNYSRKEGEWIPNEHGGVENYEATRFLKRMNERVYAQFPHAATIAEESTAWSGVSRPTYEGGLGFGFKWNMGWMHNTLNYMQTDPIHRKHQHHRMTFGMIYAYTENFILPLSHDEVVHGKGSLLGKMPGDEWQRFANLRAYYGFMFGHPGKKLLFMGGEFGQVGEWSHETSLDWHVLHYPLHSGVQSLVRDLNHLYRNTPALYRCDYSPRGFEWLKSDDAELSVFAFLRRGDSEREMAFIISNFTPMPREGYRIGVPLPGYYEERINTDASGYGGSNIGNYGGVHAEEQPQDGRPFSLSLTLPPLSTLIFTLKG